MKMLPAKTRSAKRKSLVLIVNARLKGKLLHRQIGTQ
jgi:hypothetical protein